MTGYLLDTKVVSELIRPKPDKRVTTFVLQQQELWLSVVSLHELTYGAELIADTARRARLMNWIGTVEDKFVHRLIDIDATIAHRAGRLRASAQSQGRVCSALDALIAACALSSGLTLATRNTKDFLSLDIPLHDPWQSPTS